MLAAGYPNCGSPYAEAKMIEPVTLGDLAHDGKLPLGAVSVAVSATLIL